MSESTVGGSRTVWALAADRPPVQFLADAPQRLYGWLRVIKATQRAHSLVFIDPFHTQELGIHSYLLKQHFYTHETLTSATQEIKQERATRVRLVIVLSAFRDRGGPWADE